MKIEKITNQIDPKSIQTIATSSNWGKVESPDKFDILISQNMDKFVQGEIFADGNFISEHEFQKLPKQNQKIFFKN